HHAFVTEFAGPTTPMEKVLDFDGRFGARETFERTTMASSYVRFLEDYRFWPQSLVPILGPELDIPAIEFAAAVEAFQEDQAQPFIFEPIRTLEERYWEIFREHARSVQVVDAPA